MKQVFEHPCAKTWRKRLGLFLILFSLAFPAAFAQGTALGYLYVYPSDPSAYPDQQGNPTDPTLQGIFADFQVVAYVQSFAGAQSVQLQNAYEIHCNGNVFALKDKLHATSLFDLVEIAGYMELANCPTSCNNPVTINDPNPGYQFDLTQAGCAWTITQGNPDIIIGISDTYIDLNDDDLNDGQIYSTWGPNDPNTSYHGTWVAGMIVATPNNSNATAGLAPNCKVAGYSSIFNAPWLGIWQAYLDGRRIINVSWSGIGIFLGQQPITILQAVHEMVDNGVLLVVAAGNGDPGSPSGFDSYANIPGVVMVSTVTADNTPTDSHTYNANVDLCAPGFNVAAVDPGGAAWGTSVAAPAVCAAAGLILSVNPCLKPAEIENILKSSACPMAENPLVDPSWVGAGALNLYQAVLTAQGRFGAIAPNEPTWTGVTYVSADIIIPAGVTLDIQGTVKFSEGAGMIIEPGGRVNLYRTLTSSCFGPWKGVTVKGFADQSQYTAGKHGRLYTYAGAVIENATTGVRLWDGGIISAITTTIQNNGTGVEYCPYSNFWPFSGSQQGQPRNHFGGLTNCSFLNNDDFAKAAKINAFVQMNGVRGIDITGCSFQNHRTIKNPMGNDSYGYGIKATDARFTVASLGIGNTYPLTSYDHSDFFGLGYGIYVGSAQTPNDNGTPTQFNDDFVNIPYTVQQATFTECAYGIHNRFVSQGVILGNTFNLGHLPPANALSGGAPFTTLQYGIFFENGANGFEMQENKFLGTTGNVSTTFGSYSQNLGWFNNDIRRNTYSAVNDGNVADENNAIFAPSRGLHYLCNTNADNKMFDFFVFDGADIRKDQGLEKLTPQGTTVFQSAANSFTKLNSPDGDFSNGGPSVRYFHHGTPEKPQFFSGLTFGNVDPNDCTIEYCLPPCKIRMEVDGFKQYFATERTAFNTVNAELQQAILSGNEALANSKEPEAAARRLTLDNLANLIALHEAYDTVVYNLDSVRVWWKNMDSPISEMNLARDYFKHGETNKANSILNNLAVNYPISESLEADVDDFREIMLLMNGQSAQTLSPQQTQQLLAFANGGNGVSAAWAKNILTVQGFHFPPVPKMPQSNAIGSGDRGQDKPNVEVLAQFSVSPNPASDWVEFSKKAGILPEGFSVEVSDMTGKIIWQARNSIDEPLIWDTKSVQNGLYFYSILLPQGLRQSGRIVVMK